MQYLTVKQTAALLATSEWAVYDAIRRGAIKAVKVGRRVRIPESALQPDALPRAGDSDAQPPDQGA